MATSKNKTRIDAEQLALNFFEVIEHATKVPQDHTPGSMDIDAVIRLGVTNSLKKSPYTRYEVAARMSNLIGREITKTTMDTWSAESKHDHNFPLKYLPAFVEACGDRSLVYTICKHCMGYFIENRDAILFEIGKLTESEKEIKEKKRALSSVLKSRYEIK